MISIFNGRERRLGKTTDRIFAQFDVAFRRYIHLFKNARLHVFLEIALHSDEWGFSWPSAATICKHTGYGEDTVWYALRDLEALTLDGARVLQRFAARAPGNRVANNVYLVFPTDEELERYRDASFALVDDPDRGRVLRITLRPGIPYPPDFPYSENPGAAAPSPENPRTENPPLEKPAMAQPTMDFQRSGSPTKKQKPDRSDPVPSRARAAITEPKSTTSTSPGHRATKSNGLSNMNEPGASSLDDSRDLPFPTSGTTSMESALRTFAEANGRPANPIEIRSLTRIAEQWTASGGRGYSDGWSAIEAAIIEAVESGSSFVAVRRIEAICERWCRPEEVSSDLVRHEEVRRTEQSSSDQAWTVPAGGGLEGVWRAVVEQVRPHVSRSALQGWLGEISLVERRGNVLVAELPDASTADWVAGRYGPLLERAASVVVGEPVQLEIRAARDNASDDDR